VAEQLARALLENISEHARRAKSPGPCWSASHGRIDVNAGIGEAGAGLVVLRHARKELYQRLVEAARNRLAELEYGIGK